MWHFPKPWVSLCHSVPQKTLFVADGTRFNKSHSSSEKEVWCGDFVFNGLLQITLCLQKVSLVHIRVKTDFFFSFLKLCLSR